jgi:hypothetical protein
MDDYVDVVRDEDGGTQRKTAPKAGTWASMNYIQRGGVIGFAPFFMLSLVCNGNWSMFFGLLGWSWILMGYVAGNLWKFRHAVHYWWSVTFASIAHAALLPVYAKLVPLVKGRDGKGYMYLTFGLMIAEVLSLLFVLKHAALWLHRRNHHELAPDQDRGYLNGH